jgi:predicted transcriptional regulator
MNLYSKVDQPSDEQLYILQLIEEGQSYAEIGRIVKKSRECIRQIANKFNYAGAYSREATKYRREEILEKINKESVDQIKKDFNLNKRTIYNILTNNNSSIGKIKRDKFIKENAQRIEAIKNGASIYSQSLNRSHENKLHRVLKYLKIKSKHKSKNPKYGDQHETRFGEID